MSEVNLEDDKNVYKNEFKVTNNGTLDGLISVIVEINENEFSDETLMYSIYDETGLLVENFLEGQKELIIAKDIVLKRESSKDLTLVIWIKDNGENQNIEMKKNLTGQVRIDALQKVK